MRRAARMALVPGTLLWAVVCSVPAVAAGTAPQAVEITQLRDGPGRDLITGRCTVCHSVEYIPANAPAMDRGAWQKSVQKMREKFGAPITEDEAKQILDYLATNYSGKKST